MNKSPLLAGVTRAGIAIAMVAGLLLAAGPTPVQAGVNCISISDGNWTDASIWSGCNGLIPHPTDTVVIAAGTTVVMDDNSAAVESLTVAGTLKVGASPTDAKVLSVGSDSTSSFILIETGGQIIPSDFPSISNSIQLKGYLTIADGATLTLPVGGLSISRDFLNEGTFNNATATVTFTNRSHLYYTSGHEITFFSVVINSGARLWAPNGVGEPVGSPAAVPDSDTNFNIGGNWTNNGTFFNGRVAPFTTTVTFNGVSGQQFLWGSSNTNFYKLVNRTSWVSLSYILTDETTNGVTATIIVNNGVYRRQRAITGAGQYLFALAGGPNYSTTNPLYTYFTSGSNVIMDVTSWGNLVRIQVDRVDRDHPNAVGRHPTTGYGIGYISYWNVTTYCEDPDSGYTVPCASDGGDFRVNITLPHGDYNYFRTNYAWDGAGAKDCRFLDPQWECGFDHRNVYDVAQDGRTRLNLTATPSSDWAVGSDEPTAVNAVLSSSVLPSRGIQLSWTVLDQTNVRGYNVLRSETPGDLNPARLNAIEIPVQSPGATDIVYAFDDLTAQPSVKYYYTLEKVDFSSTSSPIRTLDYQWFKTFVPMTLNH